MSIDEDIKKIFSDIAEAEQVIADRMDEANICIEDYMRQYKNDYELQLTLTPSDLYWLHRGNGWPKLVKDTYKDVFGETMKIEPLLIDEFRCLVCDGPFRATSHSHLNTFISAATRINKAAAEGRKLAPHAYDDLLCSRECKDIEIERRFRPQNIMFISKYPRSRQLVEMDYSEYLATDEWKHRREMIFSAKGKHCAVCGSFSNLHIHHVTYQHRGYEFFGDLTVLCASCHKAYHDRESQEQSEYYKNYGETP